MNELTPDEHNIIVDAIHDSATVIHKGRRMNERIKQLMGQALDEKFAGTWSVMDLQDLTKFADRFAELIVKECVNREQLLGAIARGWCSEKNSHKTMDPDLALAIFDEVEQQIKQQFGVEE